MGRPFSKAGGGDSEAAEELSDGAEGAILSGEPERAGSDFAVEARERHRPCRASWSQRATGLRRPYSGAEFGVEPLFEFGGNSATNPEPINQLCQEFGEVPAPGWRRNIPPPHNRPHEAWKLPLVAPARSAGSDRHRVELLAADDHGDQERSLRQAQQEDQPAHPRLHHVPAADRRSAPALCSAWASLTGPRLGSPRHQARPSRSHHLLAIRRRPLRGLSRLDDGPARKRRTLPQRTPPPPPQSRRSKRCARERCANRAQRCRT